MSEIQPTILKISFKDSPTKISFAPSGVWGGPNNQGQIIAHFFVEGRDFPDTYTVELRPEENKAVENMQFGTDGVKIVREVQAIMVLQPDLAEVLGNWLIQNAQAVRTQLIGRQPVKVEQASKKS